MHPRILFVALLIAAVPNLHGQKNYQKAYLVDKQNKQLPGLIADQGEIQNSQSCLFRADEQSDPREYKPEEISGYGFTEGSYYESKHISLDNIETLVFAQCLVKGAASLYYYRDANTELYFIEKEGSEMLALTAENDTYIRMLKASFSDCMAVQSSIENVALSHRSLQKITCAYNECVSGEESCTTYGEGSRIKIRIGPSIGLAFNNYTTIGQEPFMYFDFDNSMDMQGGLLLDLSSSRLGNHLSFQLGSELSKSSFHAYYETSPTIYSGRYTTFDVTLEGLSLKIYGGAKYTFTEGRVRPGLGGGLMVQNYIQSEYHSVETAHVVDLVTLEESVYEMNKYFDIPGEWFYGAYLQAGVDMDLTQRITMFANITGGFAITNPNTIAAISPEWSGQFRVKSELMSIGFNLGILF